MTNLTQSMFDKIVVAIKHNVEPMNKNFILGEKIDNEHLYEFPFNVDEDYYNLMRSVDLNTNESEDEFDLIYYDKKSITNYMDNFKTMSDDFLVQIREYYRDLSEIYQSLMGIPNPFPEPHQISDLIGSMYYDGDNYFLRITIGHEDSDKKATIYCDPMLNIQTKQFFFRFRYYINNVAYDNFEQLKIAFMSEFFNIQ